MLQSILWASKGIVLMEDPDKSPDKEPSLEDLGARVKKARAAIEPKGKSGINESNAYGMAMRLVAELVSGLVVGMIIGYFLDKALDTKPLMLLVFIFLGLGAGIFNVMRAARQIEEAKARKPKDADKAKSNEG